MNKEEFERILIKIIQRKKYRWGNTTWGNNREPPKIELLSYFCDSETAWIRVSYRINDFVTICDAIPNFNQ